VVAASADLHDWAVVLGGIFPKAPGAQSVALALASEGLPWDLSGDGRTATGPGGVAVARAADGVLVVASSEAMLGQALPARSAPSVPIERTGAGGFGVDAAGVNALASALVGTGELEALLAHTSAVTGAISLGERVSVTMSVTVRDAPAVPALSAAIGWLEAYGKAETTVGANLVRAGLQRSSVASAGPGAARVEWAWEREEEDRGFALAADALRDFFRGGTP
jgi:hypothetical protein